MNRLGFHTGLKTLLTGNAVLDTWANTNFGSSLNTLDSNRPVAQMPANLFPALVFEIGRGTSGPEVSGYSQEVATSELVTVAFVEQDFEKAFQRRCEIEDLMIQALLADPTLGGAVHGAWVSAFEPDLGINHPKYFFQFTVSGEYQVEKA